MFKVTRCKTAPISLQKKRSYNDADVIHQLINDFHSKCYICEMKALDFEVEHLRPHGNGKYPDLKFDWNNLFLCCHHCNLMKNSSKYENMILDCTCEDVEMSMQYDIDYPAKKVNVIPLKDDKKFKLTSQLICDVFNKSNTGIREANCERRMKALSKEMNYFTKIISRYNKNKNDGNIKKQDTYKKIIETMLSRQSEFTAFKRWYIRLHKEKLQEFLQFKE